MTRLRAYLRAHWHVHLTWSSVLCLLLGAAFGVGGKSLQEHLANGGYRPGPLPPRMQVFGGAVPDAHSLLRFLTRTHNQGVSNSCVGQTVSTIVEIVQHEHHPHRWWHFSAGYIWNPLAAGNNIGISYGAAFDRLDTAGDARLRDFPADGASQWYEMPSPLVEQRAYRYRFLSWRSISPWDQHTIEYEIAQGRPIAIAIPVTDSVYALWNTGSLPTVTGQYGTFHFWHSMAGIAYDPTGVTVVNSWGPLYGYHGRVRLSWQFIGAVNAAVVVAQPRPWGRHRA